MPTSWLLFIASLPTTGATARMRLWRAIKALGCASLRDGAYLLPDTPTHAAALDDLAAHTNEEGGTGCVVNVAPRSADTEAAFRALFDRSTDYAALATQLLGASRALAGQDAADVAKTVRRLRKDLEAVRRIDFFPGPAADDIRSAWADFEDAANAVLSPGEPHAEQRTIARLDRQRYQGRTWATRRRLGPDRVASAWLIRRFIDADARFLWLASPAAHPPDCPPGALGFDFDGAAFTHVGDKVTFEVLLASFGLEDDRGLAQLARLIHVLDVGGAAAPEAAGFEAILSGARARLPDDDDFLREVGTVLDSLHTHYGKESPR
jgi:hypothetical protein